MRKIPDALKKLEKSQIEALIDQRVIFRRHSERNREILKRSLLDGICFEPLTEEFDMSVRQIQNIVYKSEEQLFRDL